MHPLVALQRAAAQRSTSGYTNSTHSSPNSQLQHFSHDSGASWSPLDARPLSSSNTSRSQTPTTTTMPIRSPPSPAAAPTKTPRPRIQTTIDWSYVDPPPASWNAPAPSLSPPSTASSATSSSSLESISGPPLSSQPQFVDSAPSSNKDHPLLAFPSSPFAFYNSTSTPHPSSPLDLTFSFHHPKHDPTTTMNDTTLDSGDGMLYSGLSESLASFLGDLGLVEPGVLKERSSDAGAWQGQGINPQATIVQPQPPVASFMPILEFPGMDDVQMGLQTSFGSAVGLDAMGEIHDPNALTRHDHHLLPNLHTQFSTFPHPPQPQQALPHPLVASTPSQFGAGFFHPGAELEFFDQGVRFADPSIVPYGARPQPQSRPHEMDVELLGWNSRSTSSEILPAGYGPSGNAVAHAPIYGAGDAMYMGTATMSGSTLGHSISLDMEVERLGLGLDPPSLPVSAASISGDGSQTQAQYQQPQETGMNLGGVDHDATLLLAPRRNQEASREEGGAAAPFNEHCRWFLRLPS